jgi:tetratricopeptide (TPR) repeat protein
VAILASLATHPNNALLIALQSNAYYGDVLHDLGIVPESRAQMEPLAQKAVSLDPNLQIARYNLVVQHAFAGRVKESVETAKEVFDMNPNHARILAGCGVATSTVGEYKLAWELIERAKQLNPHYPGWYHFVNYMVRFGSEQYEEAWEEAQKIHVEGLFLHPLFRAAVLGKLGRTKEAEPYVKELLKIKPDFPKQPHEYIRLLFVTDRHVEMIWDGLRKAGIGELA